MTKNTGKTVTLNALLRHAAATQVGVGVTSIGRDGEQHDEVFRIPKPAIRIWPGTWVATARACLDRFDGKFEFAQTTGITSPMGDIVIVKVIESALMEIAGASRGVDQRKLIDQMRQCGASLVLLDGALGRSQHASPAIAQGVILATGAALGGSPADVIRKTRERLALLDIEPAPPEVRERCHDVFARGGVGGWNRRGELLFAAEVATLNAANTLLAYAASEPTLVALAGAVAHKVWQAVLTLAARHTKLDVVVADGTRMFVDHAAVLDLQKLGGRLLAYNRIRVTGITVNPFSPFGAGFVAGEFLAATRRALPGYEVSDVILEEQGDIQ